MEMFKIVQTDIKTWDDTWPRANMTNWISLEMPDSNQSKVCLLSKLSCPANWYFPSVRRLIISLTQRSEVLWRKSVPFESISSTLNLGASCPLGNDGKLLVYRYRVRFVKYQIKCEHFMWGHLVKRTTYLLLLLTTVSGANKAGASEYNHRA